jgi:hypothetical protein
MTVEERWQLVLEKQMALSIKDQHTTAERNFLTLYAMFAAQDGMPSEGMVYFLYSAASRLKNTIW